MTPSIEKKDRTMTGEKIVNEEAVNNKSKELIKDKKVNNSKEEKTTASSSTGEESKTEAEEEVPSAAPEKDENTEMANKIQEETSQLLEQALKSPRKKVEKSSLDEKANDHYIKSKKRGSPTPQPVECPESKKISVESSSVEAGNESAKETNNLEESSSDDKATN